jgi:hypothetical protein
MAEYLYEDEFIKLSFDEELNCIVKDWQKEVSAEKFREIIIVLLMKIIQVRMQHKNKAINIFVDARKIGKLAFNEENMAWLDKDIHSVYAMNKIAKKAFFMSSDMASNLPVMKYITSNNNSTSGVSMNLFTDEAEAKAWLMS